MDIICALTGQKVVTIATGQKTIATVVDEAERALDRAFVCRLTHGEKPITEMAIADIGNPILLVKVGRRGLHDMVRHIGEMEGSMSVEHILAKLDDDPDSLHKESASEFYMRLFRDTLDTEGYMVQARMLLLHEIVTNSSEVSEDAILARLRQLRCEAAIAMLMRWHNEGRIELSTRRFLHHARAARIQLR